MDDQEFKNIYYRNKIEDAAKMLGICRTSVHNRARYLGLYKKKRHGKCGSPVYNAWDNMLSRCYNKNSVGYNNYGGRGIKVCKEWRSFSNFYKDMGDKPDGSSLDRIDNNGNYCKQNCRWATRIQQANNTTRSRILMIDGVITTVARWSAISGTAVSTIWNRLDRGWKPEHAVYGGGKNVR